MIRHFSHRTAQPELMDDPAADEEQLLTTVRQFRTINILLSRSRSMIRTYILRDARRRGLTSLTILDIGAGGGDIARWIVGAARQIGITARVICLDRDPRIAVFARQYTAGIPEISVVCDTADNLTALAAAHGPFDYIISNHFLPHLSTAEIGDLLPRLAETARHGYLLNDLRRSRFSWLGFMTLATLIVRDSFARTDGAISIRRGFTPTELRHALTIAGQSGRVIARMPGRLAVVWNRK
ncbi:MAG: methyltransferase domain-containing protein [Spirochaeta sp.]|nr:methyltransferase domain-containing protein [Spirochaeta sp.]